MSESSCARISTFEKESLRRTVDFSNPFSLQQTVN